MLFDRSLAWSTAMLFSSGCILFADFNEGGSTNSGGANSGGANFGGANSGGAPVGGGVTASIGGGGEGGAQTSSGGSTQGGSNQGGSNQGGSNQGGGGQGGGSVWPECVTDDNAVSTGLGSLPRFFFMTRSQSDPPATIPVYVTDTGFRINGASTAPASFPDEPKLAVVAAGARTGVHPLLVIVANENEAVVCTEFGSWGCSPYEPQPQSRVASARFPGQTSFLRYEGALVEQGLGTWSVSGEGPFAVTAVQALVVSTDGLVACGLNWDVCSDPTAPSPSALYETWGGPDESLGYPLYAKFGDELRVAVDPPAPGTLPTFAAVENAPAGVADVVVGPPVGASRTLLIHQLDSANSLSVCRTAPGDPTTLEACCVESSVAPHRADIDADGVAWAVQDSNPLERVRLSIP